MAKICAAAMAEDRRQRCMASRQSRKIRRRRDSRRRRAAEEKVSKAKAGTSIMKEDSRRHRRNMAKARKHIRRGTWLYRLRIIESKRSACGGGVIEKYRQKASYRRRKRQRQQSRLCTCVAIIRRIGSAVTLAKASAGGVKIRRRCEEYGKERSESGGASHHET